jgi:hypothetical protein
MPRREKFTTQQMIDALTFTRGAVSLAAKHLGCDYNTVRRYIDKYPTVAQAQRESHERLGDILETTAHELAIGKRDESGNYTTPPDKTMLIFLLKTKFKSRGYSERREVTGADGNALEVAVSSWESLFKTGDDVQINDSDDQFA